MRILQRRRSVLKGSLELNWYNLDHISSLLVLSQAMALVPTHCGPYDDVAYKDPNADMAGVLSSYLIPYVVTWHVQLGHVVTRSTLEAP